MATPFPENFLWGISSAAYQIEGAVAADGRGPSIWDTFCAKGGRVKGGDSGAIACDHYRRFAEDVALMHELGVKAYRFSIAWPRLMPQGAGGINPKGLDFYARLLDALESAGVEPWICLYHWDLPQALEDKGGWTNRDTAGRFADYAELVGRSFGDRVRHIATFNEPNVFTLLGYALGIHAPGVADGAKFFAAQHNVNFAHGLAVQALRAAASDLNIGVVLNMAPIRQTTDRDEDEAARLLVDAVWNRSHAEPMLLGQLNETLAPFLNPVIEPGDLATVHQKLDWLGLNHYAPLYARADAKTAFGVALAEVPTSRPTTGMGWEISPDAFREILLEIKHRYGGLPLYVTESGYGGEEAGRPGAVIDDRYRIDYLHEYLAAAADAVAAGVDLKGYFIWSLTDNFEWAEGYAKRFGLIHVDYASQTRTPKASYRWYHDVIAANGI